MLVLSQEHLHDNRYLESVWQQSCLTDCCHVSYSTWHGSCTECRHSGLRWQCCVLLHLSLAESHTSQLVHRSAWSKPRNLEWEHVLQDDTTSHSTASSSAFLFILLLFFKGPLAKSGGMTTDKDHITVAMANSITFAIATVIWLLSFVFIIIIICTRTDKGQRGKKTARQNEYRVNYSTIHEKHSIIRHVM